MKTKETTTERKQFFIYANFDRRRIGVRENILDWQVGDFTIIKEGQEKVMVYAILNLTKDAEYVLRHSFKTIYEKCRCEKFHDHLNKVVEAIIELTGNEVECRKIRETLEAQRIRNQILEEIKIFRLVDNYLTKMAI